MVIYAPPVVTTVDARGGFLVHYKYADDDEVCGVLLRKKHSSASIDACSRGSTLGVSGGQDALGKPIQTFADSGSQ